MNYDEAIEATVTQATAKREIENHKADFSEFVAEHGQHDEYLGSDILGWLGY